MAYSYDQAEEEFKELIREEYDDEQADEWVTVSNHYVVSEKFVAQDGIKYKIMPDYGEEVLSLSGEDFSNWLDEDTISAITSEMLERIASKIGDNLCDGGDYWMAVENKADEIKRGEWNTMMDGQYYCTKHHEKILPDENNNCSLCSAPLNKHGYHE